MNRLRPNRPLTLALAVVLAAAVAVAAAQARSRAGSPIDSALAKYSALPTFVAPGPAFDASKLRGKTIFNIPATSNVPFVVQIDQSMAKVAKLFGINFIEYANQGRPSEWVAGSWPCKKHSALLAASSAVGW